MLTYCPSSRPKENSMFSRSRLGCCALLIALASQTPSPRAMQQDAGVAGSIAVRTADVDGVKLQYLTAGDGPAIGPLHAYAETPRLMRPPLSPLAPKFPAPSPAPPPAG